MDAWFGKGNKKNRHVQVSVPKLSRNICEIVAARLLIDEYLKEEFHFTPYSTISYLVPGHRSQSLDSQTIRYSVLTKKGIFPSTSSNSSSNPNPNPTKLKLKPTTSSPPGTSNSLSSPYLKAKSTTAGSRKSNSPSYPSLKEKSATLIPSSSSKTQNDKISNDKSNSTNPKFTFKKKFNTSGGRSPTQTEPTGKKPKIEFIDLDEDFC